VNICVDGIESSLPVMVPGADRDGDDARGPTQDIDLAPSRRRPLYVLRLRERAERRRSGGKVYVLSWPARRLHRRSAHRDITGSEDLDAVNAGLFTDRTPGESAATGEW